jgi:hypothetical protein
MSKIEVDAIDKQSGSTLTLGGSGTAVTLASGATQSGFGRTGTVDWQTSIKTTGFTAVSGEGYFCNTTGGAFTVTLPASPSVGDIVGVKDYANTFDTNNLTLGRNGSNIGGAADDATLQTEGLAVTLVYADATKGWLVTDSGLQSEAPGPEFIVATGGTITTVCTNFKVHTFTGPGTFQVTNGGNSAGSNTVSYMVVAGGGGGGAANSPNGSYSSGAGGGAGGFREGKTPSTPYTSSPLVAPAGLPVSALSYPITVGGGGPNSPANDTNAGSGSNSIFSTITSAGGGGAAAKCAPSGGLNGGSGGGGGYGPSNSSGGSGNTPPVSPAQGNDGGDGNPPGCYSAKGANGGGGGGATAAGVDTVKVEGGDGGAGATTSINGSPTVFAGGGGGGVYKCNSCQGASGSGAGGTGGGGPGGPAAGSTATGNGQNGTVNTGGGAGGGSTGNNGGSGPANGGTGGSGIVIIRYKFQ